jgi:hypothetical protein
MYLRDWHGIVPKEAPLFDIEKKAHVESITLAARDSAGETGESPIQFFYDADCDSACECVA